MSKMTAHEEIKAVQTIEPDAYALAGAKNGAVVDCKDFEEALIVLSVGDITGSGTLDVKVQTGDKSDGSDMADLSGAVFSQKVAADSNKIFVGRVRVAKQKRYLRVVGTDAVANCDYGVEVILLAAREKPVTQVQTVGFNV